MFTSCFARLKKLPAGLRPVAISIGIPGWYRRDRELRLAPTRAMLKMSNDQYDPRYDRQLRSLNPRELYESLGENAVLLCWEAPGIDCHRRNVAEWFEFHLGVVVPELGFGRAETRHQSTAHYHFHRPELYLPKAEWDRQQKIKERELEQARSPQACLF